MSSAALRGLTGVNLTNGRVQSLLDKSAAIHGGGGSIGGAVARALVASDQARIVAAAAVNVACGEIVD
jgi:FlaA1/EpsC-like NDP-sugar epimerase